MTPGIEATPGYHNAHSESREDYIKLQAPDMSTMLQPPGTVATPGNHNATEAPAPPNAGPCVSAQDMQTPGMEATPGYQNAALAKPQVHPGILATPGDHNASVASDQSHSQLSSNALPADSLPTEPKHLNHGVKRPHTSTTSPAGGVMGFESLKKAKRVHQPRPTVAPQVELQSKQHDDKIDSEMETTEERPPWSHPATHGEEPGDKTQALAMPAKSQAPTIPEEDPTQPANTVMPCPPHAGPIMPNPDGMRTPGIEATPGYHTAHRDPNCDSTKLQASDIHNMRQSPGIVATPGHQNATDAPSRHAGPCMSAQNMQTDPQ